MPLRPAAFYLPKNAAIAEKRERQHENCKDRDRICVEIIEIILWFCYTVLWFYIV